MLAGHERQVLAPYTRNVLDCVGEIVPAFWTGFRLSVLGIISGQSREHEPELMGILSPERLVSVHRQDGNEYRCTLTNTAARR